MIRGAAAPRSRSISRSPRLEPSRVPAQYVFRLAASRAFGMFWEIYNATLREPRQPDRSSDFMIPVVAGDPRTRQLGVRFTF